MSITISPSTTDHSFAQQVADISGEPVRKCMQCGTCSGVCPVEAITEITPRKVIHLTTLGQRESVMSANMSWMCVSCHACEVRCPRGLDVPRIIEAVRQVQLRNNDDYVVTGNISKELLKDMPQIAMVSSFRKHTA